jgi:hypothetical protein
MRDQTVSNRIDQLLEQLKDEQNGAKASGPQIDIDQKELNVDIKRELEEFERFDPDEYCRQASQSTTHSQDRYALQSPTSSGGAPGSRLDKVRDRRHDRYLDKLTTQSLVNRARQSRIDNFVKGKRITHQQLKDRIVEMTAGDREKEFGQILAKQKAGLTKEDQA